ncbi:hypothetical protein MTP99_014295 [Tenebrio molitor]|nr:hypothetical protein MTP99_014295 [Tenebrio molitor]
MEKPYVVSQRRKSLEKYMENFISTNPKKVVVLDETWVYANGSVRKSWQDQDIRSVKRCSGDGARYIVIHAGNVDGFIPHVGKIFKSKTLQRLPHSYEYGNI